MALAFVFPGQGSQSLGMLAELAEREPVVRRVFDNASGVLDYDLWNLVQNGPEEDLNKTERTQPAMLAAGFAVHLLHALLGALRVTCAWGPERRAIRRRAG